MIKALPEPLALLDPQVHRVKRVTPVLQAQLAQRVRKALKDHKALSVLQVHKALQVKMVLMAELILFLILHQNLVVTLMPTTLASLVHQQSLPLPLLVMVHS